MYAHPRVTATLVVLRERFHWSSMVKDVRGYILVWTRKMPAINKSDNRNTSRSRIQPWEVLEMNLMSLGVTLLANNEYFTLVIDKTSPFRCPRNKQKM